MSSEVENQAKRSITVRMSEDEIKILDLLVKEFFPVISGRGGAIKFAISLIDKIDPDTLKAWAIEIGPQISGKRGRPLRS